MSIVCLGRWEDFAPVLTEILDLKKEVAQVSGCCV
jgi:hypothetical protein